MRISRIHSVLVCSLFVGIAISALAADGQSSTEARLSAYKLTGSHARYWSHYITSGGYSTETTQQLKEALKSEDPIVRWAVPYVLGYRARQEAIPIIREVLKDENVLARVHATRVLGALGDRSGIPVLQKDLAELAPRNGVPDPNMQKLKGRELERAKGQRHQRLRYAFRAAQALSELGDPSGLELAAYMALRSEYASRRHWSIQILTNLATCDKSLLQGQTIDPVSVLLAAAESETKPSVLRNLRRSASILSAPADSQLLERLAASPHVPEEDRKVVMSRLRLRERKALRRSKSRAPKD